MKSCHYVTMTSCHPASQPSAPLDMTAMLAAAQQHMQKALAIKCQSIGVPVPEHFRQQVGGRDSWICRQEITVFFVKR